MGERYWVETLGCPKNSVDSDKLTGGLVAEGMTPADAPEDADVIVVNTCAFVEAARAESVEVLLDLADRRRAGARLVATGCLAEREGAALADAIPELDRVAGFGRSLTAPGRLAVGRRIDHPELALSASVSVAGSADPTRVAGGHDDPGEAGLPGSVADFDLLRLARPASSAPWAYVKVAEGCDRRCGFCAIPSFRGPQRSRPMEEILAEIDGLGVREVVLVAQDLARWGADATRALRPRSTARIAELVAAAAERVDRVRLLYLYPSELDDRLVDAVLSTGVPYFDLSLQHVSADLLRRMRRWGDGERFAERIAHIRRSEPSAAFRTNFIVGYPGETEDDHQQLMDFVARQRLDWCGVFPFSSEPGTFADGLDGHVPAEVIAERLAEVTELADRITSERRDELIGARLEVLVDRPGEARGVREAPEIDGVVVVPGHLEVGQLHAVSVTSAVGPDLVAEPVSAGDGV